MNFKTKHEMETQNFIGTLLSEKRDALKLDWAEVGDMINQTEGNIRRIEKGERGLSFANLNILIEKLWGGIESFLNHFYDLYCRFFPELNHSVPGQNDVVPEINYFVSGQGDLLQRQNNVVREKNNSVGQQNN